MGNLSAHFSTSEMACPHCGRCNLHPKLLPALEALRTLAGVGIVVHDAYRCPEHNAAVGGVPHSEHMLGMAADISIGDLTGEQMYALAQRVPDFNSGGIGLYDSPFIHVDVRGQRARWARVDGKYGPITWLLKGDKA